MPVVECGPQRITYTGVVPGGGGAIVGSGSAPTSAPGVGRGAGTNLSAGSTYQWAVSYVTGAGETLPGPMQSLTVSGSVTAPGAPTAVDYGAGLGQMVNGGTYKWAVELVVSGGGKVPGPASSGSVVNSNFWKISIDPAVFTNDPKVNSLNYYRTVNGGSTLYAEGNATLAAPTFLAGGTYWHIVGDVFNDTDLVAGGTIAGSASTLLAGALYNVPVSASGSVTARKVYRTVAGGSQLKLVATIANNTDTTYLDTVADGSLGANAPTSDSSGLTANTGQVNAGLTSLLVTDTTPFSASGGWIRISGMVIQYTGISGSSLTLALPLPTSVSYGTEVVIVPHLTGCSGIVYAIAKGDPVNVIVTVNDTAAQTALAALVGGDGIHEMFISDGRWAITEATARANAELSLRKDPLVTIKFNSRDQTIQSGRDITITLSSPSISGTFKIQRVTLTELGLQGPTGYLFPSRQVEASSRRYSFEDVLRRIRERAT